MDPLTPLPPDGHLYAVVEIDIDSFVRGGVTQFNGEPCLFISESLDEDQWDRLQTHGEMFYLVPVSVEAARTFLDEHRQLNPHLSTGDYGAACDREWQHWLAFKETWLRAAPKVLHVRRDFWQGFDNNPPPGYDPDASWRCVATLEPAVMWARLTQLEALRASYYDEIADDEMAF